MGATVLECLLALIVGALIIPSVYFVLNPDFRRYVLWRLSR